MLENLKEIVCNANLELANKGVVIYTWGNVSGIDPETKLVVIKPSGVSYDDMRPEDMVVVDLSGNVVEGKWKPSSDTATHLELYKAYPEIRGVAHAHSTYAIAFAQAGKAIPALGTTHADYFYGNIPCTRELTEIEVSEDYEKNTGLVITETISVEDALRMPSVIVKSHGPFAWGTSPNNAVHNIVVLEKVAELAYKTLNLNPNSKLEQYVLDKHYYRKHGKNAYYGQTKEDV